MAFAFVVVFVAGLMVGGCVAVSLMCLLALGYSEEERKQ